MRLTDVHARLLQIGDPVFQTSDAAAYLQIPATHAGKLLARLEAAGHLLKLRRGTWGLVGKIDRLALPAILTAPYPGYASMQTALYHHGMISQIPNIIYAVTIGRTCRYQTPLGTVSVHHIQPAFFFGYEAVGGGGILIATPEKALVDTLYLSPSKSGLFHALPEIEFPRQFKIAEARRIIQRIPSSGRRSLVEQRFEQLIVA